MMKRLFTAALAGLMVLDVTGAGASGLRIGRKLLEVPVVTVFVDCNSIGRQVAASQGGKLLRATQSTRGGNAVCKLVIFVDGRNGQPARRIEITLPAN